MAESSPLSEPHVFTLGATQVDGYGWMPVVTEMRHEKGKKLLSAHHRVNFRCSNMFVIPRKEDRGTGYVVQDGTACVPYTSVKA
jgi:hypothetical protein